MGFLERAIRRGVREGVGKAVGNAISKAIEPKATELANKAAEQIDQAAQTNVQPAQRQNVALEGALSNLQRSVEGYATEAAKNMKVCPNCQNPTSADKKFCPDCGTKLPEETLAQGAICSSCGTQNPISSKFCKSCGTKLPSAVMAEQTAAANDAAVLAKWDERLSAFPKWDCGGSEYSIESFDPATVFAVKLQNAAAAQNAIRQYRELLIQSGFRQAGEYPNICHLYKKTDGICYHVDTEHCFEGDQDFPTIYFDNGEPTGGFDYVKPEPKKAKSFKDLLGL